MLTQHTLVVCVCVSLSLALSLSLSLNLSEHARGRSSRGEVKREGQVLGVKAVLTQHTLIVCVCVCVSLSLSLSLSTCPNMREVGAAEVKSRGRGRFSESKQCLSLSL